MALTMALESRGQEEVGLQVGKARSRAGHGAGEGRREYMFEKVVTPSDVGKLNRLVVPKHFAEKYFPLGPAARGSPVGAVLCFEDARGVDESAGAAWRFRYCYWRSSQSYVMIKGWSRFVREKRLAAGDTVSFFRAGGRLFIDCRRRGAAAAPLVLPVVAPQANFTVQRMVTAATTTTATGRGRCLRLFGVDLELGSEEPLLPDLQLALR